MVIVYEDSCICQMGVAAESSIGGEAETVDATKLIQGTLYKGIMKSNARMITKLTITSSLSSFEFEKE